MKNPQHIPEYWMNEFGMSREEAEKAAQKQWFVDQPLTDAGLKLVGKLNRPNPDARKDSLKYPEASNALPEGIPGVDYTPDGRAIIRGRAHAERIMDQYGYGRDYDALRAQRNTPSNPAASRLMGG